MCQLYSKKGRRPKPTPHNCVALGPLDERQFVGLDFMQQLRRLVVLGPHICRKAGLVPMAPNERRNSWRVEAPFPVGGSENRKLGQRVSEGVYSSAFRLNALVRLLFAGLCFGYPIKD
jgi:hypothetical protein